MYTGPTVGNPNQPQYNQQNVGQGLQYNAPAAEKTMSHTGFTDSSSSDDFSAAPAPSRKRQKLPSGTAGSTQKGSKTSKSAGRSTGKTSTQPTVNTGQQRSQAQDQRQVRQPKSRQPNDPAPLQTMAADLRASEPSLSSSIPAPAPYEQSQHYPYGAPAPLQAVSSERTLSSAFPAPVSYRVGPPYPHRAPKYFQINMPAQLPISSTDLLLGRADPSELRTGKRLRTFPASALANKPAWLDKGEQITRFMPSGQLLPTLWLTKALKPNANKTHYYSRGLEIEQNAKLAWPLFMEGRIQFNERQRRLGHFKTDQEMRAHYRRWADDPAILPEWLPSSEASWKRDQMRNAAERAIGQLTGDDSILEAPSQWSTAHTDTAGLTGTGASQDEMVPNHPVQQLPGYMRAEPPQMQPLTGSMPLQDQPMQPFPGYIPGLQVQLDESYPAPLDYQPYPGYTLIPHFIPPGKTIYDYAPGLKGVAEYALKKPRPQWLEEKEWCTEHPSNGQIVPIKWILNPFEDGLDLETYYQRGRAFEDNHTLRKPLLGESLNQFKGRHYGIDDKELDRVYAAWSKGKDTDHRWVPDAEGTTTTAGPSATITGVRPSYQQYPVYPLNRPRPNWLKSGEQCTKYPKNGQIVPISWLTSTTKPTRNDLLRMLHQGGRLEDNDVLEMPYLFESADHFSKRLVNLRHNQRNSPHVPQADVVNWQSDASQRYRTWAADPENERFVPAMSKKFGK